MSARMYKMTVSSAWYSAKQKEAEEHEIYFTATRGADTRRVRRHLAKRGADYFQRQIYRRYRRWVPKRKIRISFERERPAAKTERTMRVEALRMRRKGRRWEAQSLWSRVLGYAKKSYRRKSRR